MHPPMNRRDLLKKIAYASSIGLSGCVGTIGVRTDDPLMPRPGTETSPDPDCGPADLSLSAQFTDDIGDQVQCFDGPPPRSR